jgi:ATP-dependent protease ClpP protease subunit/uncharacterized coiled-coil protein SlyX
MAWYEIKSQVGADGEVDLFIYDEVGRWGVSADQLISEVQKLNPTRINLHVNSPGGSVSDGLTIYTFLRAHSATVSVYIAARAASIAGVIAMAGDEVVMTDESLFHIHQSAVAGYVMDNADGLQDLVDALRKTDSIIKGVYRKRTGADEAKLSDWMTGDTYFTAAEALAEGLIDRIEDKIRMVACDQRWNPADYPKLKAAGIQNNLNGGHPGGGQPQQNQHRKENDMSKELEQRIATLEAEAKLKEGTIKDLQAKVDATPAQLEAAKSEGKTEALDAQAKRIEAINALAKKHGKDGDLDAIANQAITEGKSADDFKDDVLEAIAKRPTTSRAENGGGEDGKGGDAKTINSEEYLAMSLPERRKFKADGGKVVDEA